MKADALQHIDQIRVRMDAVQLAGAVQTLDQPHMLGTQFCPTRHPIFASERCGPDFPFEMIDIRRHMRLIECLAAKKKLSR